MGLLLEPIKVPKYLIISEKKSEVSFPSIPQQISSFFIRYHFKLKYTPFKKLRFVSH